MALKTYEDFSVGTTFQGTYRRTMTEAELVTIVHVAGLRQPLFVDEEWCRENTPGGKRRFPGFCGLGIANSMCEEHLGTGHFGAREIEHVTFHKSFAPGDTLHASVTVQRKDDNAGPKRGAIAFNVRLYNQKDELCLEFVPVFIYPKRA